MQRGNLPGSKDTAVHCYINITVISDKHRQFSSPVWHFVFQLVSVHHLCVQCEAYEGMIHLLPLFVQDMQSSVDDNVVKMISRRTTRFIGGHPDQRGISRQELKCNSVITLLGATSSFCKWKSESESRKALEVNLLYGFQSEDG